MNGYIKKKDLLAKLDEEIEFNWQIQQSYATLASTIQDPTFKREHLRLQEEYINRWSECVRLRKIVATM